MNAELSEMRDRALQAEQALIEARNYHKDEVARLEDELAQMKACKMGVGDGSGQLFVYGDYDSIKAAQAIVLERDKLLAHLTNKPPMHPVKHSNFAQTKSPKWYPTPDKLWLASCPDNGLEFYATEQEALDAGANFVEDHIGDDGWDELVDQVFVAEVKHITRQTDVVKRPPDDELDEDGFDEEGNDWSGDHDCRCNYELEAVAAQSSSVVDGDLIKEALCQAIMVVGYRAGDVSTEDGSYATTCTDSIIHLESALCEALGTKHDDIEINEALELLNKLELTA